MRCVPLVGEGWAFPSYHGNAKMHYYRDGRSLCGVWDGAYTPLRENGAVERLTCQGCAKRLVAT